MTVERIDNLPACPRCDVARRPRPGTGTPSRDPAFKDTVAIEICDECAARELVGCLLYLEPLGEYSEWPLSIDMLLAEDRDRYEFAREAEIYTATDEDCEDE
jgi:hypothetical protein